MIEYQLIRKPDAEVTGLFKLHRDGFPYKKQKALKKQIAWYVKSSHFFKIYSNCEFIGCILFDNWDETNKTANMSGFGKRKKLKENIKAVKDLCKWYTRKTGYQVIAETPHREVKFLLKKSGFSQIDNERFIYHG